MKKKVSKAVIAAAGFGTRFLPQTKAMPKEMLPIVDKPIIQYVVEQLVEAGIEDIIIVTGYSKRSIEDHFDTPNEDLLINLRAGGPKKAGFITELEGITNLANFIYVRQKGSYGLARPLMNVAHLVEDEPFIYALADDMIVATPNRFRQMIDLYEEFNAPILPCIRADSDADYKKYAIVAGRSVRDGLVSIEQIVEKPGANARGSETGLASVGGYLLTPEIFSYLAAEEKTLNSDREFHLQPPIQAMIADGKPVYAALIKNSAYYDTGNKLDYLKTVFDFALLREDVGQELREYLRKKLE